ncbi:hypothetical protein FA95DRAFT_1048042 [Auriscalpium vulgare]|uniref:Uncharacterized protein n=1 Tax=Auriscalpium vulgare TaxID=40419 RepID=A0ACB8SAL3_9AGAM|nr:hypothetical protein FA95DRAFT_1048042 [Auriscalpium vulgare]
MSLTTEAYSHAWLEDRYYPLIEHILKHYCLAMYALGSSMAPSPQRVFLDTPNPITDEPSSRQHRTPDAAMITSFRGTLPFPPRNIPPSVLGFFWEAKAEEHDCNWNSTMSQTNCIAKMVPHLLQLRMQAKYAFRHFGGTEYHAFLSLGFFWTLVKLKKRSKPEDDGKLLHAADPGPGPSSRKRRRQDSEEPSPFIDVSEDDLPDLEPIYFCEPMFEGNWAEIKVHPLLLHALQLASANVPTSVQPSFMQPEPDYVPPVNPSV